MEHVGFRQSERVAIKRSLAELEELSEGNWNKPAKIGEEEKSKVAEKMVSGKREISPIRRASKRRCVLGLKAETFNDGNTSEDASVEDCTTDAEASSRFEQVNGKTNGDSKRTKKRFTKKRRFMGTEEVQLDTSTEYASHDVSNAMDDCTIESSSRTAMKSANKQKNVKAVVRKTAGRRKKKRPVKRAGSKREKTIITRAEVLDETLPADTSAADALTEDSATMSPLSYQLPEYVTLKDLADLMLVKFQNELAQFEKEEVAKFDSETFTLDQEKPLWPAGYAEKQDLIEDDVQVNFMPTHDDRKLKICSWFIDAELSQRAVDFIEHSDWDIICFQGFPFSNKVSIKKVLEEVKQRYLPSHYCFWSFELDVCLLVISRIKPMFQAFNRISVNYPILSLNFKDFTVITAAAPTAGPGLKDLEDKVDWFKFLTATLKTYDHNPLILAGRLGVAHQAIDIAVPDNDAEGFTTKEKKMMTKLLNNGYTDSFRHVNPHTQAFSAHTVEDYGIRSDYILVSKEIDQSIESSVIRTDIREMTHCPVEMTIECE